MAKKNRKSALRKEDKENIVLNCALIGGLVGAIADDDHAREVMTNLRRRSAAQLEALLENVRRAVMLTEASLYH